MSDKKIAVILLGSPRKDGNTEQLADSFAKGAEEAGYEVRKIHLAGMKLNGCVDCRRCWNGGEPCVQKDDMTKIYPELEAADVIVFASPLYYYSWSSQIKPVWDRLLPYSSQNAPKSLEGKRAILLSAAGDNEYKCFDGLKSSFKNSCALEKWQLEGIICTPSIYVKTDMATKGKKFLFEALELGKNL